jgi:hypothetical protein
MDQTTSAEIPADANGVQVLRSGQSFGSLCKKTQRFGMSRCTRLWFTVDFEARMLYYSHSEFDSKVSMSIPFRDILGVKPVASKVDERRSWKSWLPRLGKDERELHDFIVYTKGKHVELRCGSVKGAQKWIATIRAAMLHHKEDATKQACNDDVDSQESTRPGTGTSRMSSMTNRSELENSEGHASDGDGLEMDEAIVNLPSCVAPLHLE